MGERKQSRRYMEAEGNATLSPKEARRLAKQKVIKSRKIGYVMTVLQLIATVVFGWILFYLDLLAPAYTYSLIGILAFFVIYTFFTQLGKKRIRLIGKILSGIFIIVLTCGSYYLFRTYDMLAQITGGDVKTDTISIIVLKDDPAQNIEDASGYNFGISQIVDRTNTNKALADLNADLKTTVATTEYADFHTLTQALYDGKTNVIILNEAYRSTVEDDFPTFSKDTRVLKSYQYKTRLSTADSNVKVTKEPFIIYLCGNDQTGEVTGTGRSDVNICAVVNPQNGQVLLVSTPRDAFIELIDAEGQVPAGTKDKLTHASNFGVDSAIKTLDKLYDINIAHYIRVNFTGFVDIVDALGGITIDSPFTFTSIDGYYFEAGVQELDGTRALHYARERKAFPTGDLQRNKNQTQVLTAILDKVISPSILANYGSLMEGVSNAFLTSFSTQNISDLVKMQQSNNIDWEILSYNVMGTPGKEYVYSISSFPTDIVYLDDADVRTASALMKKMLDGDRISQEEIDQMDAANSAVGDNNE